ncbi:MAG: type II toxin-antitoxin system PemK/MazF family toxin [Nanoarchaeota archaeon]|nr:type II toxin-antitoxin system PemK/MazF family toxin [Nanoarchaeota archaeon]
MLNIKRGDIFLINLEPVRGSKQGGVRPCLIIQNNYGNRYSPLTIIAPITSRVYEKEFPTNVFLLKKDSGLDKDSTVLLNQVRTIDKKRLIKKVVELDVLIMKKINKALMVSLELN